MIAGCIATRPPKILIRDELDKAQLTEAEIRTRYVTPALSASGWPLSLWHLGYSSALQPLRHGLREVGRRRYTLQTSTAPPSTVMDVPVAIGCCIAYT